MGILLVLALLGPLQSTFAKGPAPCDLGLRVVNPTLKLSSPRGGVPRVSLWDGKHLMGQTEFFWSEPDRSLQLLETIVTPKYRRQGVNRALTQILLQRFHPVAKISAPLGVTRAGGENLSQFMQALGRGLTPEQALRETPAYRNYAHFGFSRLLVGECRFDPFTLRITVVPEHSSLRDTGSPSLGPEVQTGYGYHGL